MTDIHIEPIQLPEDMGGGSAHHADCIAVNIGTDKSSGRSVVLLAVAEPSNPAVEFQPLFVSMTAKRARAIAASLVAHADQVDRGTIQ